MNDEAISIEAALRAAETELAALRGPVNEALRHLITLNDEYKIKAAEVNELHQELRRLKGPGR